MVSTILRNLMSNAIKYTSEEGSVTIFTKQVADIVEISVSDTGNGMDAEILTSLFSLEDKKSKKGTKGEKGTGLGLNLCKEFINIHKQKIWAVSEKGKGSTFTFTLAVCK